MPSVRQPRSGSMQYWPRKRAQKAYARIRTTPVSKEAGLVGFAGYKAGMGHLIAVETSKHSHLKGEELSIPYTIIECPPMKLVSVRFYKKTDRSLVLAKEILLAKKDKALERRLTMPKETKAVSFEGIVPEDYADIRVIVHSQPGLTGFGKKKPEVFEMGLGGSNKDKLKYIIDNKDKEITLNTIFKEGDVVDLKSITKGKGFQGPVRRFGISLRQSKSEKAIRNPGSLGPWCGQGHIMYRVAHAGRTGYNQRTEYNKQILKILLDGKEANPISGLHSYGLVKGQCLLVKGSVSGARKRLVILQKPMRPKKHQELPTVLELVKE